jgi:threonine/homoserine/homoserine lactone efflux protein
VISLVDLAEQGGSSPRWVGWLKIVLGALLVALAVRKWLARPRDGSAPDTPKWMSTVHALDATKAFGLAFVLAAANPKNLVIVASAATVIAEATSRPWEQLVALLVFVMVAGAGVAAPAVVRRALGRRSGPVLASADAWMTRHSAVIMSGVLLVLGAALLSNGVAGV